MNFGDAITALKNGEAIARGNWQQGSFIVLMPELQLPAFNTQGTDRKVNDRTAKWIGKDTPLNCRPYITQYNAQKQWQPGWVPTQADMLAEDWEIFEVVEAV